MAESFTDWQTPKELFEPLHKELKFAVDAAAGPSNHLLDVYYGEGGVEGDALSVPLWLSPAWLNPPYNKLDDFLGKAIEQTKAGVEIVALLPAAVGTQWWNSLVVEQTCDILFLTGRVRFTRPGMKGKSKPNHDSALVFYSPFSQGRVGWLDWRKHADVADK